MQMTLAALAACVAHYKQSQAVVKAHQHTLHVHQCTDAWDGMHESGTGEDYDHVYHELLLFHLAASTRPSALRSAA